MKRSPASARSSMPPRAPKPMRGGRVPTLSNVEMTRRPHRRLHEETSWMTEAPRDARAIAYERHSNDGLGLLPPQPKSDLSDFGQLRVPNSGKPEFGWGRAGEGGSASGTQVPHLSTPTPNPSPPQVGLARLAHANAQPRQARGAWGGEPADLDELDDDRLREECGVFGIFGHADAAAITALGLHALQRRGHEAAGIASFDGQQFHSERRMGLVGDNFSRREVIERLPGTSATGHVRYSTTGETVLRNVQPLFAELDGAGFALGHNGNLTNGLTLRRHPVRRGDPLP